MRTIAVAVLCLWLAGCGAARFLTASVANPVTKEMMYNVEQTAVAIIAGLNSYRVLCLQRAIPASCRTTIKVIQPYTKSAAAILPDLRRYFRENDTLNAINAYNALVSIFASARATAIAQGVPVQ